MDKGKMARSVVKKKNPFFCQSTATDGRNSTEIMTLGLRPQICCRRTTMAATVMVASDIMVLQLPVVDVHASSPCGEA